MRRGVGLHLCLLKNFKSLPMNKKLWRFLLPFLLLGLPGCSSESRPARFSSVSEGGFSPESSFIERGYALKNAPNQGTSNRATLVRCHWWQGVVTVPETTSGCEIVAGTIRETLNKALGGVCRDELSHIGPPNPVGKSGRLFYFKDGMQGEVHVWLFGASSESAVRYAIFLREEKAPPGSSRSPAPRWQFWRGK